MACSLWVPMPIRSVSNPMWRMERFATHTAFSRFCFRIYKGPSHPQTCVAMLAAGRASRFKLPASLERCRSIDQDLDAMKTASELRDASRQMGRQVLRVATNLGEPFASHGLTADLFCAVENEETPGHHAMAFGAVGGVLGWLEVDMACAFLFSTCAGLVAAALRLLSLGQLDGQRILWALRPVHR